MAKCNVQNYIFAFAVYPLSNGVGKRASPSDAAVVLRLGNVSVCWKIVRFLSNPCARGVRISSAYVSLWREAYAERQFRLTWQIDEKDEAGLGRNLMIDSLDIIFK